MLAALVDLGDEHVLLELLPVARLFPEPPVDHLGGLHLDIARGVEAAAHVGLEFAPDHPAVRVPEHHARRLLLEVEEVHLAADPAMIAPRRLLEHGEIGLELLAVPETDPVDALEHLVAAVAAPVGAGHLHQLEGVGRELPGALEVGAAAEVLPVAVPVHPHRLALGDRLDQFDLVGLTGLPIMADRLLARPDLGPDWLVGGDDLAHALLDGRKILLGEGFVTVEVVVPAVLYHRTDGHLGVGEELLHRAGHDMGEVVADDLERLLVPDRQDAHLRVALDRPGEIPECAVDPAGNRCARQRIGDRGGDFGPGHALRKTLPAAVGQGDGHLGALRLDSFAHRPARSR